MSERLVVLASILLVCFTSGSLVMASQPSAVQPLKVAVASNFSLAAEELFADFGERHDIPLTKLLGSSGKLTAQISQGLDVHVFMAADTHRPKWLEEQGFAVKGSRFTYAYGRLAAFSSDADFLKDFLKGGLDDFKIAIANPKLAPYGAAAEAYLRNKFSASEFPVLALVMGESVAQAFQFAVSGAAEVALIAESQLAFIQQGYYERLSADLYPKIEQQAVLLKPTPEAQQLMLYLKSDAAREIIKRFAYGVAP